MHFPRISIIYSHEIEKIISASEDGTIIVWSPLVCSTFRSYNNNYSFNVHDEKQTLKMEGYYTPLALSKSKSMFGSCMLSVVTINSERLWVASPIEGKIFLFNYSVTRFIHQHQSSPSSSHHHF